MNLGPLQPLADYRQFILASLPGKIPFDPSTGEAIDPHNPANWMSYDAAAAAASARPGQCGIGFVLTAADPFWCLDIDGALQPDGASWSPLALELCGALAGTVVEVSQSGRGLHIWGRGDVPPHAKKNTALHIELYSSLRYILLGRPGASGTLATAATGLPAVVDRYFPPAAEVQSHGDGPRPDWRGPTDDADLIRRALQSRSASAAFGGGATFRDLWECNGDALAKAYPGNGDDPWDGSTADAALAAHLGFWTGYDRARMQRLMLQSGLRRDKYDRPDYLPRTVAAVVSRGGDVCQDRPSAVEASAPASAAQAPAAAAATRVAGNTFLSAADQQKLFAGCVYVLDQHRVLTPGGRLLSADRFKAWFGGYAFQLDNRNEKTTRDAFEAFTQSQAVRWPRADATYFDPRQPYGTLIESGGTTLVNTYWPAEVKRTEGDVGPFLRHVAKLFPDNRDQQIVLSYLAFCVQHQGTKAQWAPIFIGCEGNGKTFLSVCAAYAVGDRYVHWPTASKLGEKFNGWLFGRTLYCVEDIYTPENRVDILEALKPMITSSRGIEVERKGVDQFNARICGNFIFNSNHPDAVRKTRNDRRWAVLMCAQQSVDDLVRDGMAGDYMYELYRWADAGGLEHVAHWLATWPIPDEFNPATGCPRAPYTSSTDAAIKHSLGSAEHAVLEAIESGEQGFRGGWVSSYFLGELLSRIGRSGAIPLQKRRGLLQSIGYDWHPGLPEGRAHNVVLPDGIKSRLFVRIGSDVAKLTGGAEIARAYQAAQSAG